MNLPPDSIVRLFVVISVFQIEALNSFSVLNPIIKTFIITSALIGPLSIIGIFLLLKKIERDDPNRIRWN